MSTMEKKKQLWGVALKVSTMTPDEKIAYYKEREANRRRIMAARKEEIYEWKQETLKIVTSKLKELSLDFSDPNTQVTQTVLWTIHDLLKRGFHINELRDRIMQDGVCDQEGWNRIKKAVFGEGIAKIEDMGIDIFTSQVSAREGVMRQIKYMERMKKRRPDDTTIPMTLAKMHMDLLNIERTLVKDLGAIGVVGDKNKKNSGTIHIHTSLPRPQAQEKILTVDIEPMKVALAK